MTVRSAPAASAGPPHGLGGRADRLKPERQRLDPSIRQGLSTLLEQSILMADHDDKSGTKHDYEQVSKLRLPAGLRIAQTFELIRKALGEQQDCPNKKIEHAKYTSESGRQR